LKNPASLDEMKHAARYGALVGRSLRERRLWIANETACRGLLALPFAPPSESQMKRRAEDCPPYRFCVYPVSNA
jgi:hypothetical protein